MAIAKQRNFRLLTFILALPVLMGLCELQEWPSQLRKPHLCSGLMPTPVRFKTT